MEIRSANTAPINLDLHFTRCRWRRVRSLLHPHVFLSIPHRRFHSHISPLRWKMQKLVFHYGINPTLANRRPYIEQNLKPMKRSVSLKGHLFEPSDTVQVVKVIVPIHIPDASPLPRVQESGLAVRGTLRMLWTPGMTSIADWKSSMVLAVFFIDLLRNAVVLRICFQAVLVNVYSPLNLALSMLWVSKISFFQRYYWHGFWLFLVLMQIYSAISDTRKGD